MESLNRIEELGRVPGPVFLAIGVFDGVHPGHQAVLRRAREDAWAAGGSAVALTFEPHPARILRPEAAPRLLTSARHKARLIAAEGIPWLLTVEFDAAFAAQPPEAFIGRLAAEARPLAQICVGEGWAFGARRAGNVTLLRTLGERLGFCVAEAPAVLKDGAPVSSTRIREAVQRGDLDGAAQLLGRRFTILGSVEAGRQIGRTLGFPTANLRAHNEQFPPDGVYAVRVRDGVISRPGVANIGLRPTVESGQVERRLEVHLLDFDGDLYGRELEVEFCACLRPERKFAGLAELRAQITQDVAAARTRLDAA